MEVLLYQACENGLPIGILGQVWYLIVSIPDLCTLTYFNTWSSFSGMLFCCTKLSVKLLSELRYQDKKN